jgi:integrase
MTAGVQDGQGGGRERFVSVEEITRLLAACAASENERLHALVLTALHNGLRKGELLGLRWERIDLTRGIIALGRRTKSGKGRDVPLNQEIYATLAPRRSEAGGLMRGGLDREAPGHPGARQRADDADLRPAGPDPLIGAMAILEGLGALPPAETSTTSAHGAAASEQTLAGRG